MELRLIIEGSPPNPPEVAVEFDFHEGWTATYGVHPKTPGNVLHRARQRQISPSR